MGDDGVEGGAQSGQLRPGCLVLDSLLYGFQGLGRREVGGGRGAGEGRKRGGGAGEGKKIGRSRGREEEREEEEQGRGGREEGGAGEGRKRGRNVKEGSSRQLNSITSGTNYTSRSGSDISYTLLQ